MTEPGAARTSRPPADVRMTWAGLLFLHWRADAGRIRELLPEDLELDLFDGSAWVGLVPFRMEDSRFRGVPGLPGLGEFYECNVRTYVRHRGAAGVWFFSLDAQTLLPVLGGRWLWSLNYVRSRFEVRRSAGEDGGSITDYRLTRRAGPWVAGRSHIVWRTGEPMPGAAPGSLEHFLTERYWLFTRRHGRIMGGEVRHRPWPLRRAEVVELDDTLVAAAGVRVEGAPLAWASERVVVEGWKLREFAAGAGS